MNECEKVEIAQVYEADDETQIHAWIHPNGWFEMNIKAKNKDELHDILSNTKTVLEIY